MMDYFDFGILVFAVALIPVGLFLANLSELRKCLKDETRRGDALANVFTRMPLVVLAAPVFMFAMMSLENAIDPDFAARSFVNSERADPVSFLFFAIDQTAKGAAFDAMEAFNLDFARLEHKCDSRIFCTSLLIYRATVATAVAVLLLAVIVTISSWLEGLKTRAARRPGAQQAEPEA